VAIKPALAFDKTKPLRLKLYIVLFYYVRHFKVLRAPPAGGFCITAI